MNDHLISTQYSDRDYIKNMKGENFMGSFVKSLEQLKAMGGTPTTFFDAEMLTVYWETKPEIIERILPKNLKPGPIPLVNAFIANYPRTSFCPPYKEAGLFILAEKDGVLGNYCLSMPITDGQAMAMGREICGLPKKMADIAIKVENGIFTGAITRNGIEFCSLKGNISGSMNEEDGREVIEKYIGTGIPMYNIKYSKNVEGNGFDLLPTLVRQKLDYNNRIESFSECDMKLLESPHDPWAELEIVRMLGGIYTVGDNVLRQGETLEKINPMEFVPYSFLKWDWWLK
jgi:acetoacetate decarboxylase